MSKDKNQYEVFHNLLSGKQVETLSSDKLIACVQQETLKSLGDIDDVYVLHDFCDIRKSDSTSLEYLGKVMSLEKNVINGYQTFNSVVVDVEKQGVHLLNDVVFSNKMPNFIPQEAVNIVKNKLKKSEKLGEKLVEKGEILYEKEKKSISIETQEMIEKNEYINESKISQDEIRSSSILLKAENCTRNICHILDREFDNNDIFSLISELKDRFVIRLKDNRLSDQLKEIKTKNGKVSKTISYKKIIDITLKKVKFFELSEISFHKKKYKNVTCKVEYEPVMFESGIYNVVKITLSKGGIPLFKQPMMLITNKIITSFEMALSVYRTYLLRFKIEIVFRFLKQYLGWESIQVRKFEIIKNLLAIAFFLVGFFDELKDELKKHPLAEFLCNLANSKGIISIHFLLLGLKKIANYQEVMAWMKEQNITNEQIEELMALIND